MGVGCKLAQSVVYCMLFVMMSTNTEKKKKNQLFQRRHRSWQLMFFFLVVSMASMQIKSFWNPFCKMKLRTQALNIYWYIDPSAWPAGSTVKKRLKGKIVLKKKKKTVQRNRKQRDWKKNFLCHRRCLRLVELYLSWIQIYIWGKIAYFKAISDYFGFNGSTRCR